MKKTKINSPEFAERMGAYSHGYKVEIGDAVLIFTTGQIAMDKDGEKQIFQKLRACFNFSGS